MDLTRSNLCNTAGREDDEFLPLTMTVYELEVVSTFTGLLDSHGRKIYRRDELAPIGFLTK